MCVGGETSLKMTMAAHYIDRLCHNKEGLGLNLILLSWDHHETLHYPGQGHLILAYVRSFCSGYSNINHEVSE